MIHGDFNTGLASYLLGIKDVSQIGNHPLYGSLFENYIMSECTKIQNHYAIPVDFYFWRDNTGHEIDLLLDGLSDLFPIEIKSGQTITSEFFKNLGFFQRTTNTQKAALIYTGKQMQQRSNGIKVVPWNSIYELLMELKEN